MALTKKDAEQAQPTEDRDAMAEQPAPGELKEADRTAGPYIDDAESNDPPVRTDRPDVPILQTLKTGAGAHRPPDPDRIGPDGRAIA